MARKGRYLQYRLQQQVYFSDFLLDNADYVICEIMSGIRFQIRRIVPEKPTKRVYCWISMSGPMRVTVKSLILMGQSGDADESVRTSRSNTTVAFGTF